MVSQMLQGGCELGRFLMVGLSSVLFYLRSLRIELAPVVFWFLRLSVAVGWFGDCEVSLCGLCHLTEWLS